MSSVGVDWDSFTIEKKAAIKHLCETDFLFFHRFFFAYLNGGAKWKSNWFYQYLAMQIEDMVGGYMPGESLIINIPPGSGKTEFFSCSMQIWAHIKADRLRMLNVSYSSMLGQDNATKAKRILNSKPFAEMWPFGYELNRADEFNLLDLKSGNLTGEFTYRTMHGQITGKRGGHVTDGFSGAVVLDDPDKPEDMFSKVKREKMHRIISGTLKSRRAQDTEESATPFIIVQQRLHVMDATGFLLYGGSGGRSAYGSSFKYRHVCIPALIDQEYIDSLPDGIREQCIKDICDTEQINGYWSFFPEKKSVGVLFEEWDDDEYTFMAQYMQRPIKLGGKIFDAKNWVYYGEIHYEKDENGDMKPTGFGADIPKPITWEYRFITADTAQKAKEMNDYSVFCHWGVFQGRIYLINMVRDKLQAGKLKSKIVDFINDAWEMNDNRSGILRNVYIEDAASGTGIIFDINNENLCPLKITPVTPMGRDKYSRAMDAKVHVDKGRVCLPFGEKWTTIFVTEHSEFSADDTHKHDDIVDNMMYATQMAISMSSSGALGMMESLYGNE